MTATETAARAGDSDGRDSQTRNVDHDRSAPDEIRSALEILLGAGVHELRVPKAGRARTVARLVGIGETRLRRAIREGDLKPASIPGAWPLLCVADVETWIASHMATPTARAEQRAAEILRREAERERRAG